MKIKNLIYSIILLLFIFKLNNTNGANNDESYYEIPEILNEECLRLFLDIFKVTTELFFSCKRYNWIISEPTILLNINIFNRLKIMYTYLFKVFKYYNLENEFKSFQLLDPFKISSEQYNNPANLLLLKNSDLIQKEIYEMQSTIKKMEKKISFLEEMDVTNCIFLMEFIINILDQTRIFLSNLNCISDFLDNILFFYHKIGHAIGIDKSALSILLGLPEIIDKSETDAFLYVVDLIRSGDNHDYYSHLYDDSMSLSECEERIEAGAIETQEMGLNTKLMNCPIYISHSKMCEEAKKARPLNFSWKDIEYDDNDYYETSDSNSDSKYSMKSSDYMADDEDEVDDIRKGNSRQQIGNKRSNTRQSSSKQSSSKQSGKFQSRSKMKYPNRAPSQDKSKGCHTSTLYMHLSSKPIEAKKRKFNKLMN